MKHQLFLGVFILQGIFSLAMAQQHFQLNGIVLIKVLYLTPMHMWGFPPGAWE